jgi:hypothetical protein
MEGRHCENSTAVGNVCHAQSVGILQLFLQTKVSSLHGRIPQLCGHPMGDHWSESDTLLWLGSRRGRIVHCDVLSPVCCAFHPRFAVQFRVRRKSVVAFGAILFICLRLRNTDPAILFLDVSVSLKLPMTANAYLILIGSLLATLFVRRQVVYWKTITALGFYCETPELYLRHARVYNVISWVLLFVLFVVGNWLRDFTPWLFFIVILAATLAGKLKATHQYRRILREMLESDALDTDERERISRQLSKSASELLDEKRRLNRMMSGKF